MTEQVDAIQISPEQKTPLSLEVFTDQYEARLSRLSAQDRQLHLKMRAKLQGRLPEEFKEIALRETLVGLGLWAVSSPLYLLGGIPGYVVDIIGSLIYEHERSRPGSILHGVNELTPTDWIAGTLLPWVNPPLIRGLVDVWKAGKAFEEIGKKKMAQPVLAGSSA